MIIDCISDLHGHYPELEGGDLLIIAGDLTARDTFQETVRFSKWVYAQKYIKKIVVGGNHDNSLIPIGPTDLLYSNYDLKTGKLESFASYLCDSGCEISYFDEEELDKKEPNSPIPKLKSLKIWGSPWTSQFPGINPKCCAFTRPFMESLKDRWDLIPHDVDILITHSPPYGILDQVARDYGASVGNMHLRTLLDTCLTPRLHVFGHVHENGGKQLIFKRPGVSTENNTICVNASHVNERYQPVNRPVRVIV